MKVEQFACGPDAPENRREATENAIADVLGPLLAEVERAQEVLPLKKLHGVWERLSELLSELEKLNADADRVD